MSRLRSKVMGLQRGPAGWGQGPAVLCLAAQRHPDPLRHRVLHVHLAGPRPRCVGKHCSGCFWDEVNLYMGGLGGKQPALPPVVGRI